MDTIKIAHSTKITLFSINRHRVSSTFHCHLLESYNCCQPLHLSSWLLLLLKLWKKQSNIMIIVIPFHILVFHIFHILNGVVSWWYFSLIMTDSLYFAKATITGARHWGNTVLSVYDFSRNGPLVRQIHQVCYQSSWLSSTQSSVSCNPVSIAHIVLFTAHIVWSAELDLVSIVRSSYRRVT